MLGCFLKNNFDVYRGSFKQYMSSLVQSVFLIVFPCDFEQAKHICGSLAQLINQWSCNECRLKNRGARCKAVTEKPGKSKANRSSQVRAHSWCRTSRAWEARVECRWQEKVARKCKNLQRGKNNNNQHRKNLVEVLPSKYHHWEFC